MLPNIPKWKLQYIVTFDSKTKNLWIININIWELPPIVCIFYIIYIYIWWWWYYLYINPYIDIIHIWIAKPLAGLKRLARFWCLGGGGARLVQTWVWPFFVHRLAGARNKKIWCWKTPFLVSNFNFLVKSWCWKSIFWGSECIFWGSETLMKLLEGFHEVAREAWRWWSQRCVCFYFPPLHQNWPNF